MIGLIKKNREVIAYLFFGVLTTIVNFVAYYMATKYLNMHYLVATAFSWVTAVLFAYVTNRIWVFRSKRRGFIGIAREFLLFIAGRVISGLVEILLMFILVDMLLTIDLVAKAICSVVIVVLNYVFSKLIIFKRS